MRYHVHGNAFEKGNRLKWLFDFSLTLEAEDDSAAQNEVFVTFMALDVDITEIEEADDE